MGRRVLQVVSTVAMVALCVGVAFAQEGEAEVHTKSWFDLFKSTGLVGILLVITSMIGTAILTTSHGVMTGRDAVKAGVGGEVLCNIW